MCSGHGPSGNSAFVQACVQPVIIPTTEAVPPILRIYHFSEVTSVHDPEISVPSPCWGTTRENIGRTTLATLGTQDEQQQRAASVNAGLVLIHPSGWNIKTSDQLCALTTEIPPPNFAVPFFMYTVKVQGLRIFILVILLP